jgi:hypothetical protein
MSKYKIELHRVRVWLICSLEQSMGMLLGEEVLSSEVSLVELRCQVRIVDGVAHPRDAKIRLGHDSWGSSYQRNSNTRYG